MPGLTEAKIRNARPGAKARILWDERVHGLGVRIAAGGLKAYVLDYRADGRRRRWTLARVGEISLSEAREHAARELIAMRAGGTDPMGRRAERAAAPTFRDLWQRFVSEYAPDRIRAGRMKPRTLDDYTMQARRYLLPAFGDAKVAAVRRADVERLAGRMAATPTQRNRVLALASRLFTLAETWEWRPQHTNPARGVTRAVENARDRTLSPSELAALGRALDGLAATYPAPVGAIRLAAMTGWRIGEALALQWSHVEPEAGRAVLPDTKSGRSVRMLARPALALLASVSRVNGNDFVFPGRRGGVAVTYRHVGEVFRRAAAAARLEGVRLHDLRRTVATNAAAAGVGLVTLRDVLGHKTTTMAARYARQADTAVAAAAERTGGEIAAALGMSGDGADVIALKGRRA
ncbi:MAG: tyrosine-type recombinase/integrase [Chloroflexi bacterium]|nr:tyrosine-type recombinase/integrase [Chloroflexota bacterium]